MKTKLIILLGLFAAISINPQIKLRDRIVDLRGFCKFEIGDDDKYASPDYDDSHWDEIYIPSTWEDEGYPGYDGYAWYRIHFKIDSEFSDATLYMILGAIDDVDETYLNGQLIGFSGTFPPNYSSQYFAERRYVIPKQYLNYNADNVIAVRVYDLSGVGGIVKGKPGIYTAEQPVNIDVEISGLWKFNIGDHKEWADPGIDDSNWKEVPVPSPWDYYGYKDFDGFAWYRKKIYIPNKLEDENLILLLGKIDDMDETFFNGEKIGGTGWISDDPRDIEVNNYDYQVVRAYYIPRDQINFGAENLISVRVYDGRMYGGIFEGPIGIVSRDTYLRYKRKHKNSFQDFIRSFFD